MPCPVYAAQLQCRQSSGRTYQSGDSPCDQIRYSTILGHARRPGYVAPHDHAQESRVPVDLSQVRLDFLKLAVRLAGVTVGALS